MKRFVCLMVAGAVFVAAVLASASSGAFTSSIETKSKLFQDYLITGFFNDATEEVGTVSTGLDYIKAFGANVSQETVSSTNYVGILVRKSSGNLLIKSYVTTGAATSQPSLKRSSRGTRSAV